MSQKEKWWLAIRRFLGEVNKIIKLFMPTVAFVTAIISLVSSCRHDEQIKQINNQIQVINPQIQQIENKILAIHQQKNDVRDVGRDNNQTNVGTFNQYSDVAQKTFADGRYAIGSIITGKRTRVHAQLNEAVSAFKQKQYDLAHDHIRKALELFEQGKSERRAYGGVESSSEDEQQLERMLYTVAFSTAKNLNLTNEANSYLNDHWFGPEGTALYARDLAQIGEREAARTVLNRVFEKEPENRLAKKIEEEMKL